MSDFHIPVFLKEAIDFLDIQKDCWYIDCNVGGGGHTEEILKKGGKVIGIDLDPEAIAEAKNRLKNYSENLILIQNNFTNLDTIIKNIKSCHPELVSGSSQSMESDPTWKMPKQVRHDILIGGILFDLGTSSHQLDKNDRGFSFNLDAPLDMRMDQTTGVSAKDLVNGLYEKELTYIFTKYGEESFGKLIARKIVEVRKLKPIETTLELASVVESVKRRRSQDKIHPATQIFQALRIAVNDELFVLETGLKKAFEILSPNGRLVVISFHSLEDRIVKNVFRDLEYDNKVNVLTKKPLSPSDEEINTNPRSRSAKLRVLEKI